MDDDSHFKEQIVSFFVNFLYSSTDSYFIDFCSYLVSSFYFLGFKICFPHLLGKVNFYLHKLSMQILTEVKTDR